MGTFEILLALFIPIGVMIVLFFLRKKNQHAAYDDTLIPSAKKKIVIANFFKFVIIFFQIQGARRECEGRHLSRFRCSFEADEAVARDSASWSSVQRLHGPGRGRAYWTTSCAGISG
jgi:hypothetical protein